MSLPLFNHPLGTPFVELTSVDSTNNYALAQIHANLALPGTCYFAHLQTGGRGQHGKSWASEKGANILLSIVLKPLFLQPFQQFHLSACIAVAIRRFISKYAGEEARIKWPNDLYWQNRKLGGVLIENIIGGDNDEESPSSTAVRWKWAVIGIGININQSSFPPDLKNPVSLKQVTGKTFNTLQLAKSLCTEIDECYGQLMHDGIAPVLRLYNEVLYKKDEWVNFKKGNRGFRAMVRSVGESGELNIQHSVPEKINYGDIEWVIGGN